MRLKTWTATSSTACYEFSYRPTHPGYKLALRCSLCHVCVEGFEAQVLYVDNMMYRTTE